MTLQKQYQFKGLNLRQSDILIPPEFASYASNCDLNYSGELRKRNGFELSATAGLNIIYMVVYQQANELLIMCSNGLYKKVGAAFTKIPMSITGVVPTWTGDITSVELNGTMYFSDTTAINPVFKYDGITFTQAGVHEPLTTGDITQLVPSLSVVNQLFGKTVGYAKGLTAADQGQLLIMGQSGPIYQFLDTNYGFISVASSFAEPNTPFIYGTIKEWQERAFDVSENGNILVKIVERYRDAAGFAAVDLYVTTYQRTALNQEWARISQILVITNFDYQFSTIGRIRISKDGTKVVLNVVDTFGSSGTVYTLRNNGPIGTWALLATPLTGVAGQLYGSYFDLNQEDTANYFLAVCAPKANASKGAVYIYKYNTATNVWGAAAPTINSPNGAAWTTDIFGEYVTIISNKAHLTGELMVFIPYKAPGGTNNRIAMYYIKVATMTIVAGSPYYINMPANIYGTIVTAYETINSYGNQLVVSAPDATTTLGTKTRGVGVVFEWRNQGTIFDLVQTLPPPEVSYDNGAGSTGLPGFSTTAVMLPFDSTKATQRIAVAYPGFNILNVNARGKVYTFRSDPLSQVTTSGYIVDKDTVSQNTQFVRFYLSYVDVNGNLINSEAKTQNFGGDRIKITVRTSRNTKYNDRYFIEDSAATAITEKFNTSPPVVISSTKHNVIVGDKVLVKTYTRNDVNLGEIRPIEFQLVTVTAVTATTVTIDISKIADKTFITNRILWNGINIIHPINGSNMYINIFISTDEFFNYELVDNPNGQAIIPHETDYYSVEIDKVIFSDDPDIFLLDIYDDTVIKKEIPYIRYLGTYQNLLLGANIRYPEEQEKAEFRNRFIWSDASIGGSVETFTPFDYEVIGENIAKELTAVIGTQDNIHVFKNRKCYAISGILIGGQYRVRELISEETGCVNHNSMIAVRGQVLFMSEAGIYSVAGGANPNELSDANQPLFMAPNIDLYRSTSTFDGKLERVYTFLKNTVDPTKNLLIVWNYYFNQWYLYEGMGVSGPMVVYNDRLNIVDGIYLKEMRDSVFSDIVLPGVTTKPVYFKYYTGWFHLGLPSIRKKFVNLVLFSILRLRDYAAIPFSVQAFASEPPNFSLDIKTQLDWIATDWDNFNVPFATDKRVDDHKLTQTQCKSIRYLIENNRDEPVLLTGYEFEWESTQDKPKGLT